MRKFFKVFLKIILGILILVCLIVGYIKFVLPNVAVDQTVKIAVTSQRVARGKYLANHVAVCMDCHSKRDWNFFAGPMQDEGIGGGGEVFNRDMGFPGEIYARNITPAAIGNWTDGEILRAISSGVNKDGKALFPLMNYHRFGQMGKDDIYSIIAYIRTLKPVQNVVPESQYDFPVNLLINTFPKEANYQSIPPKTSEIAYGNYLANASGCIDCHSRNDQGKVVPGSEYGGGMTFGQLGGTVTSPNLTPHLETGLGHWSKEAFVKRFKAYAAADYAVTKVGVNDLNTPMPWNMYAGMTEADLGAIFTYLQSVAPIENKVNAFKKK